MTKLICQLLYSPRTLWDSKYYIWSGEYLVRAQITFPFHIFCFPWLGITIKFSKGLKILENVKSIYLQPLKTHSHFPQSSVEMQWDSVQKGYFPFVHFCSAMWRVWMCLKIKMSGDCLSSTFVWSRYHKIHHFE